MKNLLAVIVGLVIGSAVNMALIMLNPILISLPEGADVSTMESLQSTMHLFQAQNFIFPFLAHALGTLVGAMVAAFIAESHKMKMAYVIGFAFLAGGLYSAYTLPAPVWFIVLDLFVAYLPMAWFGGKVAVKLKNNK
jgi:hypothetical protein